MQLKPQLRLERIFDVAHNWGALGSANVALKRIFVVTGNKASCDTGPELAVKYKVPQDNQQYVMSVTNRCDMLPHCSGYPQSLYMIKLLAS